MRHAISQLAQQVSIAGEAAQTYGLPMTNTSRTWPKAFERTAVWSMLLVMAASLLIQTAPPIRADGCGDASGANVSAGGCTDPAAPPQAAPPWLAAVQQRDPQFGDSYMATRERILKDGAIPAKYKLLMGMITDAIAAHPDGVRSLADNARAAGASEAEVTEAVEVGYLYGGTAALVMGVNAFG
jgi:alkylhydroperoxidase/carboxymuconolactone decarboxylase family protein YurZ